MLKDWLPIFLYKVFVLLHHVLAFSLFKFHSQVSPGVLCTLFFPLLLRKTLMLAHETKYLSFETSKALSGI